MLSRQDKFKLDNMSPEAKGAGIGALIGEIEEEIGLGVSISGVDVSSPIIVTYEVTADATLGLNIFNANCPFPIQIRRVDVECRATSGGGTLKLTDGTNDITDAITCAVDTTCTNSGTIDGAYSTISAGGTLAVVTANAADRALVTIYAVRVN